jgi:hypothetical protein
MSKNLLILNGSSDICTEELMHIATSARLFGITPHLKEIHGISDVQSLKNAGIRYDYIYLCAHADQIGFGDNKSYSIEWTDFGTAICLKEVLNEGCVFLLACCRSGLNKVAFDLFYSCVLIEYVCGPRWTLNSLDLSVAFNVFLYNMEHKRMQPDQAAERMSQAVGFDFRCYDRIEVESTLEYQRYCETLTDYLQGRSYSEESKEQLHVKEDKIIPQLTSSN